MCLSNWQTFPSRLLALSTTARWNTWPAASFSRWKHPCSPQRRLKSAHASRCPSPHVRNHQHFTNETREPLCWPHVRGLLRRQTEGHDDIATCPRTISRCPHIMLEVVAVAGLQETEPEQTPCLITVGGVTVLPAADVDSPTLNPALTRHGIYLTEGRKKTYSCATWTVWVTRQETVANGLKCHWSLNPLCHVRNCCPLIPRYSCSAALFPPRQISWASCHEAMPLVCHCPWQWSELGLKLGQNNHAGPVLFAWTAPCVTRLVTTTHGGVRCGNSKQPRHRNSGGSKRLYSAIHHSTQSSAGAQISTFPPHALFHKQISAYFQSPAVYNSPLCALLSITDRLASVADVLVSEVFLLIAWWVNNLRFSVMPHRPWRWMPEWSPLGQNLRKCLQSGAGQQLTIDSLMHDDGKQNIRDAR